MACTRQGPEQSTQAPDIRFVVDTIPTLAWSARPDGSADFFNRRWLDYSGLSAQEALEWGWKVAIHPDDLPRMLEIFREALGLGRPFEVESRVRRSDGEFRWFLVRGSPLCDASGKVVKWYGTNTDIEDRKRAEEILRESEKSLRLMVDGIAGLVAIRKRDGEVEFDNNQVLEYFGKTLEELKGWTTSDAVHPDDLPQAVAAWMHSVETGDPYDVDHRLRRADGAYRWFHSRGLSLRDAEGRIVRWYNLLTDIDERQRAEEKLRRSEAYLSEAQKLSHTGSFGWSVASREIYWSEETYNIFEHDPTTKPTLEFVLQRVHTDDRNLVQQTIARASEARANLDFDCRLLMPSGLVKHLHVLAHALETSSGNLEYVGAVTDVTGAKQAEEKIRQSEMELRQIMDLGPQQVGVLGPDRSRLYVNQSALDYHGLTLEEWRSCPPDRLVHPDDLERVENETQSKFLSGSPFEVELRLRRRDGQYRWVLFRWNPLRDGDGSPRLWY